MFLERRNKYSYLCPVKVFWPQEFASWHFPWFLQFRLSLLWTPYGINVFLLLLSEFTRICSHNACQIQQFLSPQLFFKKPCNYQSRHSYQTFFDSDLFMWKTKLFSYFLLKCFWSGMFWRMIAGIQSHTVPWFQLQSQNVKKYIVWSLPLRCLKNEGVIQRIVWACQTTKFIEVA